MMWAVPPATRWVTADQATRRHAPKCRPTSCLAAYAPRTCRFPARRRQGPQPLPQSRPNRVRQREGALHRDELAPRRGRPPSAQRQFALPRRARGSARGRRARARVLPRPDFSAKGAHALAIFASGPAGLFQVIKLPRPVDTGVAIDDSPFIEPLADLAFTGSWAIFLISRKMARILRGSRDSLEEIARISDDVHGWHDQGGWSQARFPARHPEGGRRPRKARGGGPLRALQARAVRQAPDRLPPGAVRRGREAPASVPPGADRRSHRHRRGEHDSRRGARGGAPSDGEGGRAPRARGARSPR